MHNISLFHISINLSNFKTQLKFKSEANQAIQPRSFSSDKTLTLQSKFIIFWRQFAAWKSGLLRSDTLLEYNKYQHIQTWDSDYLRITTTCQQQHPFWGPNFSVYDSKLPLNNEHMFSCHLILEYSAVMSRISKVEVFCIQGCLHQQRFSKIENEFLSFNFFAASRVVSSS